MKNTWWVGAPVTARDPLFAYLHTGCLISLVYTEEGFCLKNWNMCFYLLLYICLFVLSICHFHFRRSLNTVSEKLYYVLFKKMFYSVVKMFKFLKQPIFMFFSFEPLKSWLSKVNWKINVLIVAARHREK